MDFHGKQTFPVIQSNKRKMLVVSVSLRNLHIFLTLSPECSGWSPHCAKGRRFSSPWMGRDAWGGSSELKVDSPIVLYSQDENNIGLYFPCISIGQSHSPPASCRGSSELQSQRGIVWWLSWVAQECPSNSTSIVAVFSVFPRTPK